ncbi:MAG: DUF434 domain-containing protein, partial [Sedimentisphaerales bacterium]|nr:DUF434 domain-containing protein [Sedimentisphaerales bacterium]
MPDKRKHRGPHPEDHHLFAPDQLPIIRQAIADYSMLRTKGYSDKSSLKLVGDHFALTQRQRTAVMRSSCSDPELATRQEKQLTFDDLKNQHLLIDGYNILTTIEAALAGGVIIICRDGCLRDLASIHGTFRKVNETAPALEIIGKFLTLAQINTAKWLLDQPVSNSGRLKILIQQIAQKNNCSWPVELAYNPDDILAAAPEVIITADSVVLNRCDRWFNLTAAVIDKFIPDANIINLAPAPSGCKD